MKPTITLDGLQLHPLPDSGVGFRTTMDKFTGWYGTPSPRTDYQDRQRRGVFYGPNYADKRDIGLGGLLQAPDRVTLLQLEQKLSALGRDPNTLHTLTVVDETGERFALVQRSGETLLADVNDRTAKWSLQLTAPDPLRYSTTVSERATSLRTRGAGGLDFGSSAGTVNLLSNPSFESALRPWTVSGAGTAVTNERSHDGALSLRLTPDGMSQQCYAASEHVEVLAGETVNVSAWVWFSTAAVTQYSTSVNWFDSSGTYLSTSATNVSVLAGMWAQVANTFTVPAGAVFAAVVPTLGGKPAETNAWFIDDVAFVRNAGLVVRHNLSRNPALAVNDSWWSGDDGTGSAGSRTTVTGFGRTYGFEVAAADAKAKINTPVVDVDAGAVYTFSVYAACSADERVAVYVQYNDGSGSYFGNERGSDVDLTGGAAPTRISMTVTVPAGVGQAYLQLYMPESVSGDTLDVTEHLVERTDTLQAYFDGDSDHASWDGTEGASTSTFSSGGAGLRFPLDFGEPGTGGRMVLHNAGTAGVLPTFTITGPVSQPALLNVDTGQQLSYADDLGADDSLVIDCAAKTVVLNGTVSRFIRMARKDFGGFVVEPGVSLPVAFLATGQTNSTARVRATYREAWW